MEVCKDCGEVIVWDGGQWISMEGTAFCVLNRADGHHSPAVRFPVSRVVDIRRPETAQEPLQP